MRLMPLVLILLSLPVWAASEIFPEPDARRFSNRDFSARPDWVEESVSLPPYPRDADLVEFPVSAATANHFFVDAASLSIGKDGVVRFTLVIRAVGGATNVSYEGIRCDTASVKRYAIGRADGAWAWSRIGAWQEIENKQVNRHFAALNRDFFCPLGNPIRTPEEGRDALRRGQHPDAGQRHIFER